MKFTARDFVKIRWPLLACLLLLIAAGLLAAWSAHESQKAQFERETAESRRNRLEQQLRQARSEAPELKDRAALFRNLQASGITGEERRLEWTEMLRAIQQELHIPGLNYEFGAQSPLDGAGSLWFASPLRLELRLLHEEDLLNFLARLEKEAKALVLVRHCRLERLAADSARAPLAQLKASCEMSWLTSRHAGAKP